MLLERREAGGEERNGGAQRRDATEAGASTEDRNGGK